MLRECVTCNKELTGKQRKYCSESCKMKAFPLYPHQEHGVTFLEQTGGKGIIAFEQGLGKTRSALTYLDDKNLKTVVVCPAGIKFNWTDEIRRWCPGKIIAIHLPQFSKQKQTELAKIGIHLFKKPEDRHKLNWDYLIISYRSLFNFVPLTEHDAVLIDECHRIGNANSQQCMDVQRVCAWKKTVIMLSGTPLKNNPAEFYSALNIVAPHDFASWDEYIKRYCNAKRVYHGAIFFLKPNGTSRMKELNQKLQGCMLRYSKEDVDLGLPDVSITHYGINIDLDEYQSQLQNTTPDFKSLALLRSKLGYLKVPNTLRLLKNCAKPVIIFHHHHSFSEAFLKEQDAEIINGKTQAMDRASIVQSFQSGDIPILLASTMAASEGISLTAAKTIILAEREWTSADEEQAIARAHRVGLKHPLKVYIMNAKGTIDEHISAIVDKKKKMIDVMIDGKGKANSRSISKEILRRLFA